MGKLKLSTKQKLPRFHLGWPFQAVEEKNSHKHMHLHMAAVRQAVFESHCQFSA